MTTTEIAPARKYINEQTNLNQCSGVDTLNDSWRIKPASESRQEDQPKEDSSYQSGVNI